jgi:ATP phosphoribosyltransferase regulatory subunit
VDIANVDFLKGVLEEAQLDSELSEAVTDAIVEKNYVEVVKLTEELNIADKLKTLFNDLPLLIGDVSTLDTAKALVSNEKSINAIEYMRRLYEILDGCGYSKCVSFDLSVTGHFDYYTGIVFRAYARGTGFSVIDGGRYDKLVGNYGEAYPAVGLAVKINDIMSVIKPTEVKSAEVLVAYDNNDEAALMALRMADELRKSGKTAELSLVGSDIETNKAYALKNNIGTLLYINGKECRTIFVKEAE